MTFGDWLRESRYKLSRYGVFDGARSAAFDLWSGAASRLSRTAGWDETGDNYFDREWDVLLILDTCRPDALDEVATEYDYLDGFDPERDTVMSIGSTSFEWMDKTFSRTPTSVLSRTDYVCANGHASKFGNELPDVADTFGLLDPVWEYGWDDEKGCVPPRRVTDRAIEVNRSRNPDRMIVHYMQPHAPYRSLELVERKKQGDRDGVRGNVWDLLQAGNISRETAWNAYVDNLRWVLDDLELLLENLDAERVVITSDHGEAFGRLGFYGHYRYVPLRELREVPWVTVQSRDEETYEPRQTDRTDDIDQRTLKERLRMLGYRE